MTLNTTLANDDEYHYLDREKKFAIARPRARNRLVVEVHFEEG